MKDKLVPLLPVMILIAAAPAHAGLLNFDFTLTGDAAAPGTLTGEIIGLTDNATSSASAAFIFSDSLGFARTLPYNTIADAAADSFTVVNGTITSFQYQASNINPGYSILLQSSDFNFIAPGQSGICTATCMFFAQGESSGGLTFTAVPAAVPEPAALGLLGLGLAGVAFSRRRRKT